VDGPEVGREGDTDAPRNGGDGVLATGGVGEQSAHGVDDREKAGTRRTDAARRALFGSAEPAAEEHKEDQDHRGVAGGLDALAAKPSATANQISANANSASTPIVASHARGPTVVRNRDRRRPDEDGHAGEGLDQAAEHVTGEDDARAMAMVRTGR